MNDEQTKRNIVNVLENDFSQIDQQFMLATAGMKDYLEQIKEQFDGYDQKFEELEKQISYIESQKHSVFAVIDEHFRKVWNIMQKIPKEQYETHKAYFQYKLHKYFAEHSEINRRICEKPFGYDGDFIMMSLIYDYHEGKYLGDNSFERLINNYTCNIPVSSSNIQRKNYIKEKISTTAQRITNPKILSVGCGPAQELFELIKDKQITKPFEITLLDFERKAIEYIEDELKKHSIKGLPIKLNMVRANIIDILKSKNSKYGNESYDLIYVSGVFDYLGERACHKILAGLYKKLNKKGNLLACNISLKNDYHRAYYEIFGGWEMNHRSEDEVLSWVKDLNDFSSGSCELIYCGNYLVLNIAKL
ncbi:MAG: class I SAM-dependent methyltransferase [Endomicrobiales bacterium]|jgi:extracellular factor (EF) 3-hydroxypalmitic acid methyl ester biosynthesis protein